MDVRAACNETDPPSERFHLIVDNRRKHLLIAGTGRAGTSFLVQYLHAVGLDTHLSRHTDPHWSASANAGLEDMPLIGSQDDLPYVVKSPWIGEFVDQVIRENKLVIDGVLIPIRDLRDAAASRVVVELRNIYETSNGMLSFDNMWDNWAATQGGVLYSLDVVDQERLLAVKFTRLVQTLVNRDIRLIFLDFPKIVEDAEYLYRKLRDYIPVTVDLATAVAAHRRVANQEDVRVTREREAAHVSPTPTSALANDEPPPRLSRPPDARREFLRQEIDLIALRREIARHKKDLRDLNSAALQLADAQSRTNVLNERLRDTQSQIADLDGRLREAQSQVAELESHACESGERLSEAQLQVTDLDKRLREAQSYNNRLEQTVARLRARSLKGIFRRLRGKK
jgi:hypothetical protein